MSPTLSTPNPPTIPFFYRVLFAYVDPALAFVVTLQTYLRPLDYVAPYLPNATPQLDHLHRVLLNQLGAAYLGSGLKTALLLVGLKFWGKGEEVSLGVWKAVIAGFLAEDCGLMYSFLAGIRAQGRLSLAGVSREEWPLIGLVGTAMVLRTAFLMGSTLR